jgi:DNA-binding beta-propeller fold protein YncE
MRFCCAVLILLGLGTALIPSGVLGEAIVQPVRCVEVITTDDSGNDLSYPSSLYYDVDSDEIYVTSPLKNKLVLLTSGYFPYMSIGAGRGLHNLGSCFQKDGRLYICVGAGKDDRRGHLAVFNGAFLPGKKIYFSGFEGSENFQPRKVVVGATGNIYVVGLAEARVVVLDSDGNYLRRLEPRDEAFGVAERAAIISLDVGEDGNLYLLSEIMGRVYVYDRNEKFLYKFGQKGGESGKLARPRGVAVDDRTRRIFVVDYQRHSVSAFSLSGEFLYEFGGMGQGRGWLNYPSDVCVDGFGRVLVADTFNHRVQVFEIVEGRRAPLISRVPGGPPASVVPEDLAEPDSVVGSDPAVKYVLQVGFARDPDDAQRLYRRLAAKGYSVRIEQVDQGDKGIWYKVQIGLFADSAAAKNVAHRLKVEEGLTALLKKRL